jgi:hypothetical protein
MNRKVTSLLAAIVLTSIPVPGRAQDFSADVIYVVPSSSAPATAPAAKAAIVKAAPATKAALATKAVPAAVPPALHSPSRLYVSKNKIRLETLGITGTVLIVNWEEHSVIALFPPKKEYQPLSSGPPQYFHVEDPENACPDWQKVSERKLDCEKVGHEVVDGRDTVKYKNKAATPAAPLAAVWIDPTLNFVAKWEDSGAAAELRNINKQEKLSSALFEVPKGYEQMRPKKKAPKGPGK